MRGFTESTRRRLEVATAMAWEALTEVHTTQALNFILLLEGRMSFEDALLRYLREMDLTEAIAAGVRTRVLVALEDRGTPKRQLQLHEERDEKPEAVEEEEGWRRFRPDVMVRAVMDRQKRNEETEGWVELALARAEESVIRIHIDNAITFAALLEDQYTLGRGVQAYLGSINLGGGRSQSVFQRTMAQLADVHLPKPASD